MVILVIAANEAKERISSALAEKWQLRLVSDEEVFEEEKLAGDLAVIALSAVDTETSREIKRVMRRMRNNTPILAVLPAGFEWDFSTQPLFDDFVYLDFSPMELKARVWQLLYRHQLINMENMLSIGELLFDFDRYEVRFRGYPVDLTFKEYELLRFLATHPGKVFTREMLLEQVWGYGYYGGSRTVDVHIRRIRSKIDTPEHDYICTVRGAGYLFEP